MNIGLLGYGKMGKEIEAVAKQRSHAVAAVADIDSDISGMRKQFEICDVLIDFSAASAVVDHVKYAGTLNKPIVIGTTGWQKDLDEVRKIVNDCGIAAVVASNFSLGVNLFISTVEKAAKLFGQFEAFDCAVLDCTITKKSTRRAAQQSRSATLSSKISLRRKNFDRVFRIAAIAKDELQINSIRVGSEYVTHSVFFIPKMTVSSRLTHQEVDGNLRSARC